uniref:Uncharacterized protein n=1 Tax=Anopheles atroparvus TaxID=41427 RepID=A0A182IRC1_ANOAO
MSNPTILAALQTAGRDGVRKESVASTDTSEASGWSQDRGQGTLSPNEETDTAISSAHRAEAEDPESNGQPRHRRRSFDREMLARGEELATQKTEARRYADCTDFRVSGEQRTLTEGERALMERAFQEGRRAREEDRRQQNTHEGYHEDRMVNYDQEDGVSVSNNKLTSSILTVRNATARHGGNYTCAPANARQSSVYVHVLKGEKPAAMQHPNKNPTATSGASAAVSRTASRFSCLRLALGGLLPATAGLIVTLVRWLSTAGPSAPLCQVEGQVRRRRRRRDEPRHRHGLPEGCTTALLCILIAPLLSVKTIFSKSIKLFDVV